MNLEELEKRAKGVREKYAGLEMKKYSRQWTREQIFQGLVGDVGDLSKLIIAYDGVWDKYGKNKEELKGKIGHELSDCLWAIIILSDQYGINLGESFEKTMVEIENYIEEKS